MISMMFLKLPSKRTVICILRFYTNKQYFNHVFYPSNYDRLIPSNTQGFPVLMKVSQRLSTSLPYAGDRSLYRRAFQDNLSSILHYLLHTLALLSSISRAIGKIFAMWCRHCQLVSKIPISPCILGLWAFYFSFDNVF